MILVVGPNLAVDRTLDVPGFQTGRIFRTARSLAVAGGKGANVSRALKALGSPVHLVGLVAGWTGRFIGEALAEEGIPATLVETGGVSRTCTLVVDSRRGDATVVNEEGDLTVSDEQMEQLGRALDEWIPRARVVVCSGSLPPALPVGFHAAVVERARRAGVLVVLDTSGPALQRAVDAGPHLVKPNRAELLQLTASEDAAGPTAEPEPAADGAADGDMDALVRAAHRLLARGVGTVVVSMGAAGALAVTAGQVWIARAPVVPVVDPIGAGDSMVAALAHGLHQGWPLPELLATAVASGTTDVTTFGGGVVTPDDVSQLRARVTVQNRPFR